MLVRSHVAKHSGKRLAHAMRSGAGDRACANRARRWLPLAALGAVMGCGPARAEGPRDNLRPTASPLVHWPSALGERPVSRTIRVRDTLDGKLQRFYGVGDLGPNSQDKKPAPLFTLDDGATLSNVILGDPSAGGVLCQGSCTLDNVWWEKAGEGAATFRGDADGQLAIVNGGGASGAFDKVFQHSGAGTVSIKNFYVEWFGKLYRSCGNCKAHPDRHVILENVTAVAGPKSLALVGINENFGDTAEFRGINTIYDQEGRLKICLRYRGVDPGEKPAVVGSGPSPSNCKYDASSVRLHGKKN